MRLTRRCLALLLLLATGMAEAQARSCPMDSEHHTGASVHESHAVAADAHEAHGATGPTSRVHDVPADPVQDRASCTMSMACAPAAVIAPARLSLAARRPDPLSTDWPHLQHTSADVLPHAPPPRLIA